MSRCPTLPLSSRRAYQYRYLAAEFPTVPAPVHWHQTVAHKSRLKGATDYTRYGAGRASSKAFLTHHVANISTAIQVADANSVLAAASHRSLRQSLGLD